MSKSPTDRAQKGGFAAPIVIDSAASAKRVDEAKPVGIFEIDGVAYTMPAVVRAEIALEYLALMDADPEGNEAAYYLFVECLGRPAYDALKAVKGLTEDQFEGILTRIRAIALPKGKTPTTSATRG
jgi:hypothetical protein